MPALALVVRGRAKQPIRKVDLAVRQRGEERAACVREPLASSHVTNATIHAANRTLRTTFSNLQADTAYVVQVCACEGVRKGERECV